MSTLAQPGAPRTSPLTASSAPADEELVRRMRRGDERAFEAIYERYRLPLHRYCHSIVRQREDAEEAFQATMLGAFRALTTGEEREIALRAWLYRIAHNECISTLRRRRRQEADELSGLEVSADDVAERIELAEDLRQLQADLAQLSESQRSALVMRELGGLGHAEIARALGRDAEAVKQLIYEARMSLHTLAEGRALACETVRRRLSDGDGRALRGRGLRAHLRSCAGCHEFQAGLARRPARLALIAPVLPAVLFHDVLAKAVGVGVSGMAASGAGAGGAGAAALGGGATATGVAGGLGAKLVAIGSAALIGGTAAGVPAVDSAVHASAPRAPTSIGALMGTTASPAAALAGPMRSAATPAAAAARGARASVMASVARTPGARASAARTSAAAARGATAAAVPRLGRATARAAGPALPARSGRAGAATPASRPGSAPAEPLAAATVQHPALAPLSEPRGERPGVAPAAPAGGPDASPAGSGATRRR